MPSKITNSVPQKVLTEFYLLPELEKNKRCKASVNILTEIENSKENRQNVIKYCLDRLIKGLSSSRSAARVGFATCLTEIIKNYKIPVADVLTIVEKSLPVETANELKEHSIGQVLALLALVRGAGQDQISEETCVKFVSLSMNLYEKRLQLKPLCVQMILILSQKVGEKIFQSKIWPSIKTHCQISLDSSTVDEFYFVFGLRNIFPKFLTKHCKFLSSDDWKSFTDSSTSVKFMNLIVSASTTHPAVHPGLLDFLEFVIDDQKLFQEFYPKVFEDLILKHDHRTVVTYGYQLVCKILPLLKSDVQMDVVLTKNLVKNLLKSFVDRSPQARFSRRHDVIEELIKISSTNFEFAEKLLMKIFQVSMNFDRLAGVRFVEKVLAGLNVEKAKNIFEYLTKNVDFTNEKCSDSENSLKFLSILFVKNHSDEEFQTNSLYFLAELLFGKLLKDSIDESLRNAAAASLFDCIAYLFQFNVKSDSTNHEKVTKLFHSLENLLDTVRKHVADEQKLLKHSQKFLKKIRKNENSDSVSKCFGVFFGYLSLWTAYKPKEYEEILKEVSTCYEEFSKNEPTDDDGDSWMDVLIDIILSLSSRSNRHLKIPIDFAMFYLSTVLKFKHLEPILQVIQSPDAETMEVDDEFEPIETTVDETSDDESVADDDDDDEDVDKLNVDAALVSALEKALEFKKSDDDTASVNSDLSDDTMIRLDEQLADVFRQHVKKNKKNSNQIDEAEKFRLRCFDLIVVAVRGSKNAEIFINLIVPLLNMQISFANDKSQGNVGRILYIQEAILKKKDFSEFSNVVDAKEQKILFVDLVLNGVGQIFELSKTISNAVVQQSFADSLRFLLKFQKKISSLELKNVFFDQFRPIVEKNLDQFLKNESCLTSVSLFEQIFESFPTFGFSLLPILSEFLFDSDARLFRRSDVGVLCQCLFRHEIVVDELDKSSKKALKKFCAALRPNLIEVLKKIKMLTKKPKSPITMENFKNSMDVVKPRFVTSMLNVFASLVSSLDVEEAKKLMQIEGVDDELLKVVKILTNVKRLNRTHGRLSKLHAEFSKKKRLNFIKILKKLTGNVQNDAKNETSSKTNGTLSTTNGASTKTDAVVADDDAEPKKKKSKR